MTTKQIDYCIELARTLNFSRAAENQFVSQPTLTYQIKLLEDEIGFAVFERSGKGASLTPAGSQFVTYLTGMRAELKRAIEQGQNFSAKYKDSISKSEKVFLLKILETASPARSTSKISNCNRNHISNKLFHSTFSISF